MTDHGRGFTLVELAVVLLLLAVVASAVAVSLGSVRQAVAFEDLIERIEQYDRQARTHARLFAAPAQLVIDLDLGIVQRATAEGFLDQNPTLVLPRAYTIAEARVGSTAVTSGQIAIQYAQEGQSSDYAIRLIGPQDRQTWLLSVGLTGQWQRYDIARAFEEVMATLSDGRAEDE